MLTTAFRIYGRHFVTFLTLGFAMGMLTQGAKASRLPLLELLAGTARLYCLVLVARRALREEEGLSLNVALLPLLCFGLVQTGLVGVLSAPLIFTPEHTGMSIALILWAASGAYMLIPLLLGPAILSEASREKPWAPLRIAYALCRGNRSLILRVWGLSILVLIGPALGLFWASTKGVLAYLLFSWLYFAALPVSAILGALAYAECKGGPLELPLEKAA